MPRCSLSSVLPSPDLFAVDDEVLVFHDFDDLVDQATRLFERAWPVPPSWAMPQRGVPTVTIPTTSAWQLLLRKYRDYRHPQRLGHSGGQRQYG